MLLSSLLVISLLVSPKDCDCERSWGRVTSEPSPCGATREVLETKFSLSEAAAQAMDLALADCGGRRSLWIAAANAAPDHPLPVLGVLAFHSGDEALLEDVLKQSKDPDRLALQIANGRSWNRGVVKFLVGRGPATAAAVARKGWLELDDATDAYDKAIAAKASAADRASILGVLLAQKLQAARNSVRAFVAAQPTDVLDALRKELQSPPPATTSRELPSGFERQRPVVMALLGVAQPDDGWALYLALRQQNAVAAPLVMERVPGPYLRRLLGVARKYRLELQRARDRYGETIDSYVREAQAVEKQLEERIGSLDAGTPAPVAVASNPALLARIEHPPASPWREVRAKVKPQKPVTTPLLPKAFNPVTPDRAALAVTTSDALDPMGEVSRGAYWLFQLMPEGVWSRPIYSGLRQYRPYEVQAVGLEGETVRLKVQERALDESTVTFPPVGLRTKKGRSLVLETTLGALRLDTDHDGIADVQEARLFTDPAKADTDGDGLDDGLDPAPLVPFDANASPSIRAQLMRRGLELLGLGARPVVVTPDAKGLQLGTPADKRVDVDYLVGDPKDFTTYDGLTPIVVLTEAEFERAKATIGLFFPSRITVELSEDQRSGFISWSEGWRGGAASARKTENGWELTLLESWIT